MLGFSSCVEHFGFRWQCMPLERTGHHFNPLAVAFCGSARKKWVRFVENVVSTRKCDINQRIALYEIVERKTAIKYFGWSFCARLSWIVASHAHMLNSHTKLNLLTAKVVIIKHYVNLAGTASGGAVFVAGPECRKISRPSVYTVYFTSKKIHLLTVAQRFCTHTHTY